MCNGYCIESELDDVLKSGYCESNLSYDNVDCFVGQIRKLENKMVLIFGNTKKDIIKTEGDENLIK